MSKAKIGSARKGKSYDFNSIKSIIVAGQVPKLSAIPADELAKFMTASTEGVIDETGETLLTHAVRAIKDNNTSILRTLLECLPEKDSILNTPNNQGFTPIALAAQESKRPAVRLLTQKGADVNINIKAAPPPLHVAVHKGHRDSVEELTQGGANPNIVAEFDGETPLTLAARKSDIEIFQMLLAAGADVNGTSKDGNTALHVAVQSSAVNVVQTLMAVAGKSLEHNGRTLTINRIDFTLKNNKGKTAEELVKAQEDTTLRVMFQELKSQAAGIAPNAAAGSAEGSATEPSARTPFTSPESTSKTMQEMSTAFKVVTSPVGATADAEGNIIMPGEEGENTVEGSDAVVRALSYEDDDAAKNAAEEQERARLQDQARAAEEEARLEQEARRFVEQQKEIARQEEAKREADAEATRVAEQAKREAEARARAEAEQKAAAEAEAARLEQARIAEEARVQAQAEAAAKAQAERDAATETTALLSHHNELHDMSTDHSLNNDGVEATGQASNSCCVML